MKHLMRQPRPRAKAVVVDYKLWISVLTFAVVSLMACYALGH